MPNLPVCLYPSVAYFIPAGGRDSVHPFSFYPVGKGLNTTSKGIRCHISVILTGVHCGDEIFAPDKNYALLGDAL